MAEEFINDYAAVVEQIGKRFDATDRALAILNNKLSEQEVDVYDIKAILRQHSRDIGDIRERIGNVEQGMATKQDLDDLRTQMLDSFKQLIAVLDERLPKTEE